MKMSAAAMGTGSQVRCRNNQPPRRARTGAGVTGFRLYDAFFDSVSGSWCQFGLVQSYIPWRLQLSRPPAVPVERKRRRPGQLETPWDINQSELYQPPEAL